MTGRSATHCRNCGAVIQWVQLNRDVHQWMHVVEHADGPDTYRARCLAPTFAAPAQ